MTSRTTFPVVIVTGLSGAGKSTAIRVFEDLGFFCVDGLPVSMAPKLTELFQVKDPKNRGLALGLDLRQDDFLDEWNQALEEMESLGASVEVFFVEARLDTLVTRYAMTRRPHPLESASLGLEQALEKERDLLDPIRHQAALVIDSTQYSVHDLRRTIQEKWSTVKEPAKGMRIHILSFGFKYGMPIEADLVFDMRFLPNPHFEEELRPLTGQTEVISDYVLKSEPGNEFIKKFKEFVGYILPLYAEEGRYRITIAIGCTGGRHRSVAVSENLFNDLKEKGYSVTLEHRHMDLG
ncbi:RNase adapter RapZ [Salidesulfovibrio brasiliensis]|uniref:RNase adapter RapZ n=1 Tax=Salidesulfovibrio brasiliensis TaxID=221711 RepID=UPI0006D07BFB|nr:RNase adapter RapZ [Salidesulfovibrio brasiliensis]